MEKLRIWLNENKVFFEVLSLSFFGLSALLISGASYYTSREQLNITRSLNDPQFFVYFDDVMNTTTGSWDERKATIISFGNPATDLSAEEKTFMHIMYLDGVTPAIDLPLEHYFDGGGSFDLSSKKIEFLPWTNNNSNFSMLYKQTIGPGAKAKGQDVLLSILNAFKVSFTTAYGYHSEKFFLNNRQVSEDEYRAVARFDVPIRAYDLDEGSLTSLLKDAKDYAYFVKNCKLRATSATSFSEDCPTNGGN